MNLRPGFWIQTITGQPFDFDDPSSYQWNVEGIAHALSQINRYVGHTNLPYSVAQHCVYVAQYILDQGHPACAAMHGLLHDASEIAVGDVSSPLKAYLRAQGDQALRALEHRIEFAMLTEFGINPETHADLVKEVDTRISLDEKKALLPPSEFNWKIEAMGHTPLGIEINPIPHFAAKSAYMEMFLKLEGMMK